ncbi:hypothetical protein Sme01_05900 [Sphaerisporangium melleum]|uniref:Uncharacterized protein n=1 Tax=Sphaerisporangium melleum TaxID=321316 RepID=A0A917VCV6_9ACTN|nr:hypothetical protein [Sphaerisporangium melleum]GGK63653.1 hypothetical protein GCM10007964_03470 [Sphaerisporangium melleum]GII68114.1 hypothetical protein Sme01_05900 [Sphaerisporangium melleum]
MELAEAAVELDRVEAAADEVRARSRAVRHLLDDVRGARVTRLRLLRRLLEEEDDYAHLTQEQRAQVRVMVSLAATVVTVMGTRIVDAEGRARLRERDSASRSRSASCAARAAQKA